MHFPNLKAIVFDLDNTLLDHSAAEREAISKFLPAYYDEPSIGATFKEAPERFRVEYVATGRNNGSETTILNGLQSGEKVVISSAYQLKMIFLNQ